MRIILVIALILAIVAVSSARQRGLARKCKLCKRMMSWLPGNPHRKFLMRWICKGCNLVKEEDKCSPNPCQNDGECEPEDGSCVCLPEFTGLTCQDEVNPCQNGGTHQADGTCVCTDGYTGDTCDDEANPCQNGGTHQADGTCVCTDGYSGPFCGMRPCASPDDPSRACNSASACAFGTPFPELHCDGDLVCCKF